MLRPVLQGLIKYESLLNGEVDLSDIALLNAAIAVDAENTRRLNEAALRGKS